MVFDGRYYGDAKPILPMTYHPDAPATEVCLSDCLRAAHFYSRGANRMLGVQIYKSDNRFKPWDLEKAIQTDLGSYSRVAQTWSYMPSNITRVHCSCIFFAISSTAQSSFYVDHRVVLTKSGTDTGAAVRTQLAPLTESSGAPGQMYGHYSAHCHVDINNVNTDDTNQIYCEMVGDFAAYRPLAYLFYWSALG